MTYYNTLRKNIIRINTHNLNLSQIELLLNFLTESFT